MFSIAGIETHLKIILILLKILPWHRALNVNLINQPLDLFRKTNILQGINIRSKSHLGFQSMFCAFLLFLSVTTKITKRSFLKFIKTA